MHRKTGSVTALLLLVVGSQAFPNYDNGASSQQQSSDYGAPAPAAASSYGGSTTRCTPYDETVHVERCESYNDKVCYTTHQEHCDDVTDQNCRAIVTGHQKRQCFNVTELICGLREQVQFEVINAVFTVQRCHKVTERVCDTVYDVDFSTKDDFQCLNIPNPVCNTEERTVYEKTCRTTTRFECNFADMASSYGESSASSGMSGMSGSSSGDGYGNAGYQAAEKYSEPAPSCNRKQETKCYTTPRQVSTQSCSRQEEKVCEKLSERVPFPEERQVCHNEEKKVCELEQKTQPKQIKKYVYTKQCRSVPKVVCENADQKKLVPSCVPTTRKTCRSTPSERCEDVPKNHCYKVPTKVRREKCETYPTAQATTGYETKSTSYD